MQLRAEELRAEGIEVTARWLKETVPGTAQIKDVKPDYLRETAKIDIEDILFANVVVLNVPSTEDLEAYNIPISSWARGGRHFEAGFQYATIMLFQYLPDFIRSRGARRLVLVGHKENVFHFLDNLEKNGAIDGLDLPEILTFETWKEAKEHLI